MSRRWIYGSSYVSVPDDYDVILGANYYRDWNADLGVSTTGGLVDTWTDQANSKVLTGTGATRPQETTTAQFTGNVIEFDGVSEYLQQAASTSEYNFLHDGSGGAIIIVAEKTTSAGLIDVLVSNSFTGADVGFRTQHNFAGDFSNVVGNGSGTNSVINNSTTVVPITTAYSYVANIDADNATAADRSELIISGTSEKNNVQTQPVSVADATSDLTVGARTNLSSFFANVNIKRIIISNALLTPTQLAAIQARLNYDYGI